MTIHTKKKQLKIDDEINNKYDMIPKRIRDTGKETNPRQKTKGNDKQKEVHRSCVSRGES